MSSSTNLLFLKSEISIYVAMPISAGSDVFFCSENCKIHRKNRIEYRYSRGSRDSWWDSIHLPTVRWYLFLLQLRIIYSTYISWFNHIALYFFCTHAVWHYDKYNDVYSISSYTVVFLYSCILDKWIQMDITMRFQPSFFYPFTLSIK